MPGEHAAVARDSRGAHETRGSVRELSHHLAAGTTFAEFFGAARLNPGAAGITGVVCGVRVEAVEDPLMRKIRYLDKLVDELAKGRPLDKVQRA